MKHGRKALKLAAGLLSLSMAAGLAGCGNEKEQAGLAEGMGQAQTAGAQAGDHLQEASAPDVSGGEGEGTEAEKNNREDGAQAESGPSGEEEGGAGDSVPAGAGGGTEDETAQKAEGGDDAQAQNTSGHIPPATVKERPQGWSLKLASEDWGLSFDEPGTAPVGNAAAQDLAWYDAYYLGEESEKIVYLTFDCGYENGNTQPILDALKKHQAPATFFVVGHFLETAPDMVRRMVEEGHTVGNHTYHHPDMSAISDMETFQKEMDDVAELFNEVTGTELSPFYRPPQGKCNTQNLEMAQELGYYTFFWSLAHVDWITDDQPGHDESIEKLTKRIHPGAIVLLHNTSSTNGEILDELLTKWEEMGYSFRPLGELAVG